MAFEVKRSPPGFPVATVSLVLEKLVESFHGQEMPGQYRLVNGKQEPAKLISSDRILVDGAQSDAQIPYLAWHPQGAPIKITTAPWDRWVEWVKADVPARLKCHANRTDLGNKQAWQIVDRLFEITAASRGLPTDKDGNLVRYSAATSRLFDEEQIAILTDRSGPILSTISIQEQSAQPFFVLELMFHLEFFTEFDRRTLPYAKVVQLGMVNRPPGSTRPRDQEPLDSEIHALGQFDTPDPELLDGRAPVKRLFPPLSDTNHVEGSNPATTLQSVLLVPGSAMLAPGGTLQVIAIAYYLDGHTADVTGAASWATTDATKATVAAGLVTAVAAGTATITATWQGLTSSTCAVTVPFAPADQQFPATLAAVQAIFAGAGSAQAWLFEASSGNVPEAITGGVALVPT